VLCVELLPSRARRSLLKPRLREAARSIALAIENAELSEALSAERRRTERAQEEVRRLNVLLVRGPRELETEETTQSLEIRDLRRQLHHPGEPRRRRIVGRSSQICAILSRLPKIATKDFPVLFTGESGVGKDLLARALHDLSERRDRPFLAEICTVAESLVETELFGFVKGAFTGAVTDRKGIFERASGGTIYLDEIAELPQSLQARILRVLEEKKVRPVGSETSRPVDFRLVSSSRRSPIELWSSDLLRRDLLYRLNAEVIEIPPLRERREDILLLTDEILGEYARETGFPLPYVDRSALEWLLSQPWPGNVRQLENIIEQAAVLCPGGLITPEHLPLPRERAAAESTKGAPSPYRTLEEVEFEHIRRVLELTGGNRAETAKILRIGEATLYRKLRQIDEHDHGRN
jgi:transcriptional regulator with PAS, ATPase and Fis domain